jgi:hypothetical protein
MTSNYARLAQFHRLKAVELREQAQTLSGFRYTAALDTAKQHDRAAERYERFEQERQQRVDSSL